MESTRKIGRHHLAFYRGWLQGLDLKVAADRYLESGLDQRIARSTLAWIQQTLTMAARRHGRHALARLLRLPLGTLPEAVRSTTALPSLETFREAHDPDHFYSEKEQKKPTILSKRQRPLKVNVIRHEVSYQPAHQAGTGVPL